MSTLLWKRPMGSLDRPKSILQYSLARDIPGYDESLLSFLSQISVDWKHKWLTIKSCGYILTASETSKFKSAPAPIRSTNVWFSYIINTYCGGKLPCLGRLRERWVPALPEAAKSMSTLSHIYFCPLLSIDLFYGVHMLYINYHRLIVGQKSLWSDLLKVGLKLNSLHMWHIQKVLTISS